MIPLAIVAAVLALPQPQRIRQMTSYDLDVTVRGCLWRGVDTPEWCGPPIQRQGGGELRQLREHIRREVKTAAHR